MVLADFEKLKKKILELETIKAKGKVVRVVGLTIESEGPLVHLGEHCHIKLLNSDDKIDAEVVGFHNDRVLLMPLGEMKGIGHGCEVIPSGRTLSVPVGEGLLGRVLDGLGNPIDKKGPIEREKYVTIDNVAPDPLERKMIKESLSVGVKAIDSMLTSGKGQKVGIFAGSGVGKSTLMGMIVKGCEAQIKVVALIGERGREIPEFIHYNLDNNLENTVIIAATSDESALMRKYGAFTAMAIAEFFRDKGHDVLLMMDSVTRFAMAQREIGLSTGEPPVSRGYPPSVFALLPQLMERAGNNSKGSITAFFTVLVDGDDMNDPIADQSRSILDGHIVLTRELTEQGFYPPINLLKSASRVMDKVVDKEHYNDFLKLKRVLSLIKENEVLVRVGAYKAGMDPELDNAMSKKEQIREFLTQDTQKVFGFNEIVTMFRKVLQ